MSMKVRNYYYFIAGVLAMLFAVTHAWNGHSAVLSTPDIKATSIDIQTVFTYVWHIITIENLVFGIAFMIMSFHTDRSKAEFAAWLITVILIVRLVVIVGVTAFLDVSALSDTLIDSIAIVIYVALIMLGIFRRKGTQLTIA